jgi:hypothetical protein
MHSSIRFELLKKTTTRPQTTPREHAPLLRTLRSPTSSCPSDHDRADPQMSDGGAAEGWRSRCSQVRQQGSAGRVRYLDVC